MSYVKTTDFLAKDALASGNPLKIVKGSEIDTEFNNIATADALNLKKDGSATPTANIPMGNFKLTGLAQGSSAQDSARFDQLPSATNLLPVASGGTGSGTASGARTNLSAAASGANSDITSLSALSTPLSVAQGGTGSATLTANNVLLGNGTSALQVVAPGTTGNVLTSNGTTWVSSASSATQIQPISASVAANALTISASDLSLQFRSTTLGSGAVTTVSGTPSNLVISSGSTLGTTSAVQSDIAVLAINNAGTIELAAVNIAGGTNLDETGLISTTAEGGAGAADSATVIYSTTARTNVAYRVIGIIRSTQATAGTWATAPSLIQGAGGNAVTSMQSLGYGQTWQDVTGSRAQGTTYYNTTGKPILVSVYGTFSSTPTITVGGVVAAQTNSTSQMSAIVPSGASYVLSAGGTLARWSELR